MTEQCGLITNKVGLEWLWSSLGLALGWYLIGMRGG